MRSASRQSTMRPVSMMSNARDMPTQRGSSQLTPMSQLRHADRDESRIEHADRPAMRISAASASRGRHRSPAR
jgi:hypothetical protein